MGSAWANVCRTRLTCAVSVKEPEDEGGHLAASPASAPDPNVEKSCYTGLTACARARWHAAAPSGLRARIHLLDQPTIRKRPKWRRRQAVQLQGSDRIVKRKGRGCRCVETSDGQRFIHTSELPMRKPRVAKPLFWFNVPTVPVAVFPAPPRVLIYSSLDGGGSGFGGGGRGCSDPSEGKVLSVSLRSPGSPLSRFSVSGCDGGCGGFGSCLSFDILSPFVVNLIENCIVCSFFCFPVQSPL